MRNISHKYIVYRQAIGEFLEATRPTIMSSPAHTDRQVMTINFDSYIIGRSSKKSRTLRVAPSGYDLQNVIFAKVTETILSKYRGDIFHEILRRVKEECYIEASIVIHHSGDSDHFNCENWESTEVYVTSEKNEAPVVDAKYIVEHEPDTDFENIDNYVLELYPLYLWNRKRYDGSDVLDYLIRKKLKQCTYCFKKGKCIIPDEYLEQGEEGIANWQKSKSEKNPCNSMEKRMLKEMVHDRKDYARSCFYKCSNSVTGRKWDMPTLVFDGIYNQGKIRKAVAEHIFKNKTPNEIISMTNEQIHEQAKTYFTNMLQSAINDIKNSQTP